MPKDDKHKYYILLIIGITGMGFIISKFIEISDKINQKNEDGNEKEIFNLPNLSWKKSDYEQELQKLVNNKGTDNYKKLLQYDNIFALCYSSVYFSLNRINYYFMDNIIKNTIPIHIVLDWMENYIASKMIDHFKKKKEVKYNKLYFFISNIKWALAGFNTGTALYSGIKILFF
jgi:hypothetical protein